MQIGGLKRQFATFMTCAGVRDYSCMLHEMQKSKWYNDEPLRALRDIYILQQYPMLCQAQMHFKVKLKSLAPFASYFHRFVPWIQVNGTTAAVRCDRQGYVPATTYLLTYRT
jgi:hypothetical protein